MLSTMLHAMLPTTLPTMLPTTPSPSCCTPGSWKHNTGRTTFTLAVNDFGVKHFSKADADHLFSTLKEKHALTKDWTGTSHLGFTLDWHCDEGCVNASIPHHDPKALNKFQHAKPKSAQHAPQQWSQPVHGQKVQHANTSASPHLDKGGMSKPSPVLFSVMDEQLTQLFSQLSTKS
jgi:hypothetical protein